MTDDKDREIETPEEARALLQCLLQKALMLELSTIPAYATACYSIQERGQYDRSDPEIVNAEPIEVIRQVIVEEMLHMVLVANVMNAIGCKPCLTDPEQLPSYPHKLFERGNIIVHLRRFIPDQVKAFREVERAPQPENIKRARHGDYRTIGGFYIYIDTILTHACRRFGEEKIFVGDGTRQIDKGDYYGAGGEVIAVDSLDSAREAIREIMDEGEGAALGDVVSDGDYIPGPEEREDIAHFFKFDEILHSRYYEPGDDVEGPPTGDDMIVDWRAVWPMKDDPKGEDYDEMPEIKALSDRFNACYSELLDGLNAAFNGNKARLVELVPVMYRLKESAQRLMRVPLPGCESSETAGPTWEYQRRNRGRDRSGRAVSV